MATLCFWVENDQSTPECKMTKIPLGVNSIFQGSHLFAIHKWAALTLEQRQALAQIGLWETETYSIPLRCGELASTLEEVIRILGVRSGGEPFLSIPPRMSTSYAYDCKELLGISLEKINRRHDSEIHLGKLRWEFTGVPHRAERMMGGRAPQVSVFVGRRPSHKGKAPVGEDGVGMSESVQGESSHPSSRGAGDAEGVGRDIPDLGNGSTFFNEDTGWVTRRLDYLKQVVWGSAIVSWLHYHLCSVVRGTRYLRGCSIFLHVWAWEHITIPRPLPGRLAPSFLTIHCWSYGINWTPMRVEPIPIVYASSSQAFGMTVHLICMLLVMPTSLVKTIVCLAFLRRPVRLPRPGLPLWLAPPMRMPI
ncbi:hypothetical protein AMTR_s00083p00122040 [Amborella trichopoda]|uniref:Aminotransferase-like plant mobile domain-containing protein n=1 Tax=Amborella trichopoda TaxID=13333 RepID=W1P3L9_AMBTC|nr:hypothetical protein AMTR_s00083p00122040 [Amborella trichopoda]